MGLKWFRARLSMEKEASKVPVMTGLYRRVSHFETNVSMMRKSEVSSPSMASESTTIVNNERAQYDRPKADLASQLSSSSINDSEEIWHDNYVIVHTEPSTSKDLNLKEESLSRNKESNKMNREQHDSSNKKKPSDNELVI
ncbi:hypothetical protein ACFW04_005657 [Cataglyphis niger]